MCARARARGPPATAKEVMASGASDQFKFRSVIIIIVAELEAHILSFADNYENEKFIRINEALLFFLPPLCCLGSLQLWYHIFSHKRGTLKRIHTNLHYSNQHRAKFLELGESHKSRGQFNRRGCSLIGNERRRRRLISLRPGPQNAFRPGKLDDETCAMCRVDNLMTANQSGGGATGVHTLINVALSWLAHLACSLLQSLPETLAISRSGREKETSSRHDLI